MVNKWLILAMVCLSSLSHMCNIFSFTHHYSVLLFTPTFILTETMLAEKCEGVLRRRNEVTRRRRSRDTNRNHIATVSRATIASRAMERNQSIRRRRRSIKSLVTITGCSMCQRDRLVIMFTLTTVGTTRRRRWF